MNLERSHTWLLSYYPLIIRWITNFLRNCFSAYLSAKRSKSPENTISVLLIPDRIYLKVLCYDFVVFNIKNKTNVYTKQNFPLKAKISLQYTSTKKEDWKLAKIRQRTRQEINQQGGITFTDYSHLDESTPFTDSLIQQLYDFKKQMAVFMPMLKLMLQVK